VATGSEPSQRVDDACSAEIQAAPRPGVAPVGVERMGRPAVVERALGVGGDLTDRRASATAVPRVLDCALVRGGVPEYRAPG
jgi:hypothetical protein